MTLISFVTLIYGKKDTKIFRLLFEFLSRTDSVNHKKKACFKTITPIQNLNTNSKTVLSFFCIYIQVEPKVKVSDLKCKYGYI